MSRPDVVPYRIRVGVTGHRSLERPELLASAVREILSNSYREAFIPQARQKLHGLQATPVELTIVSALAEGADRLVAKAGLDLGAQLEAILPMDRVVYERDFAEAKSQTEFGALLAKAHRVVTVDAELPPHHPDFRRCSYRLAGEETVARSDILIALWDGQPPESDCGTGAIALWAAEKEKPVFIVSTVTGEVEIKNGETLGADFARELEAFNSVPIPPGALQSRCDREATGLFPPRLTDSLPDSLKGIVQTQLVPVYARASMISEGHRDRFFSTGGRAYLYSTLSVAFMAGAIVFAKYPLLSLPGYVIELTLLVLLYWMIHRAVHGRVHECWLEHRVLAERLRTAFYFVACGETPTTGARFRTIHHHRTSWIDWAYQEALYRLPKLERPDNPPIAAYGEFVREHWLRGQLDYHTKKKTSASKSNQTLKAWGLRCFGLAIGVSVVHHVFAAAAIIGHHAEGLALLIEEVLSVVAVTLPAAGAAVNGYRSLLEHSRISARSAGIAHHLERLLNRPVPTDSVELRHYLERVEDLMLMESQDWQKFMEHAELERIA